nr:ParB/RepB/Spo0J family partition protein [Deinococcus budaensis]
MPGDFVICEIGGQPINSGITGLHVGTPLRLDVVNRNGPSTIPQNAITCRDDYSPVAPVRVGDLVTLRFRQGELFKVVEPAGADGVVELENIAAPQDRPSSPLSGLRVTRRVNIADLYADLSLPLPSYLQEAASNGVVVEPEVAPDQPVPAEWLAQLEEWRTRFHIGARVRFPAASSTEPGAVEEFVGVVVSHEPGISEHCTVDEDGHSTVVKFRNLALEAAPTEEPALASDPAPASATPDLQAPRLTPGAIGLLLVPLSQTVRSSCNVRNHYDPQAVEELAASLAAEGQIENCTGRWNAEGQVEIVAGETRRRAQLLRVERGEIGDAYPLMVHIREMTDAEALAVSATENMRRRSMTALEECEAMQRLNDAGRSVEEIASMFGFKSLQPVHDRILVARNLHTAAREALDKGNISFAQAAVIARAPGQHLQESLLQAATSWNPTSAKGLAEMLTRGQFLVANAKFDVEASGLEIRRDLFDAFAPYFEDKAKALDAQIAWAHARAQEIEKDGGQAFVHVVTGENGNFYTSDHRAYEYVGPNDPAAGTIVYVSTLFGTSREERAKLRSNAQATTTEDGGTKVETVRPMRDSAYLEAHKLRATAARAAVLGDQHLTLALTVWGLIIGSTNDVVRVNLQPVSAAHEIPELKVRAEALANLLAPDTDSGSVYISALGASGVRPDPERVLRRLVAMSDDELLGHLNTLASLTAYDWFQYGNKTPAKPEYAYLASLTDAPQRLAASFRLTDEWLKRYPRHELLALADEAGLGRALIEDCGTLKEMRARLLEHADRLHAEGFVPALVRFPEPPATADATATAAD